jgi:hypothetical protein
MGWDGMGMRWIDGMDEWEEERDGRKRKKICYRAIWMCAVPCRETPCHEEKYAYCNAY